jgi:hypothetical protein
MMVRYVYRSLCCTLGVEEVLILLNIAYDKAPGHLRDQHKPTKRRYHRLTRGRLKIQLNSRSGIVTHGPQKQLPALKSSSSSPLAKTWSHF